MKDFGSSLAIKCKLIPKEGRYYTCEIYKLDKGLIDTIQTNYLELEGGSAYIDPSKNELEYRIGDDKKCVLKEDGRLICFYFFKI